MTAPLHGCVVRFWKPSGTRRSVAGTGFLARGADGLVYAVTCGHVANLALGRAKDETAPLETGRTSIDLMGRGETAAVLAAWHPPAAVGPARATPVADIAVFSLPDLSSPPFMPALLLEPPRQIVSDGAAAAFHTFGFMGPQDGVPSSGALSGVDAGDWFVAVADEAFGRFIEEGLSGAHVFVDGRIAGMVVQRFEREARQGLVVPSHFLARAWPPLARPYPGLPAFDGSTAHLYFGRGRPLKDGDPPTGTLKLLLDRLERQRLVGLMGASGSGKSSLARAGVVPVLASEGWAALVFRPAPNPIRRLAEAIAIAVDKAPVGTKRLAATNAWARTIEDGGLTEALDALRAAGAAGTLIVIDQYEEFFIAEGARQDDMSRRRDLILRELVAALDRGDVRCLLTGRLDLMERMVAADPVAARMLTDPYPIFTLTAMSAGEVREAIEGPTRVFGAFVDPGLAADMAVEATRGEGRLPLLQAALRQHWAGIRREPDGWTMQRPPARPIAEPSVGLLEVALGERADAGVAELRRGMAEMSPVSDADLRRVLLGLVRLVDGTPTRRLLARGETNSADWTILERLAEQRLVTLDGAEGTAELVHEALMTRWPLLVGWIAEDRDFLLWRDRFDREFLFWDKNGRRDADLLREQDVAVALDWLDHPRPERAEPTEPGAAYIRRSRDDHQARRDRDITRERAVAARIRGWLMAAATAAILALIATGTAGWFWRSAAGAAAVLKQERNVALLQESRALAALAQQQSAAGDQITAMLLSLEALPTPAFGGDRPVSGEAAAALRQAWLRNAETDLPGHKGPVRSASFSADGKRVVTASEDGTALVWDVTAEHPTAIVLDGHRGAVYSASFSADGRRVVTAPGDGTAQVWDVTAEHPTAIVLEGHTDVVTAASFSADGRRVLTASADGTARVWDVTGERPTAVVLEGHKGPVLSASFSVDGSRVVTASADGTARVWHVTREHPTAIVLEGHTDQVNSASFSPDGRRVVTASNDLSARVWDITGPHPTALLLQEHTDRVNSASFSPDGRHVVTASHDGTVRVWDVTGEHTTAVVLDGHNGWVASASFSADGKRVVSASNDGTARVWAWDPTGAHPGALVLEGHKATVFSASFSADGARVVTASDDGTARVWDVTEAHHAAMVLNGHKGAVNAATFSADGRRLVTASYDHTARVWDVSGRHPTAIVLEGHKGGVASASFGADGRRVLTASDDGTARVWDISGEHPTSLVLASHMGAAAAASFNADGSRVVTGSQDGTARVWDVTKEHPTAIVLEGHTDLVGSVSFSADGRRVATASNDCTARVWDVSGEHPTALVLEGHEGAVTLALFSADGSRVVTASEDGTARVWDVTGDHPAGIVLEGHKAPVTSASFSADGSRVVTASGDGTARVWDVTKAHPTATVLAGHTGKVASASFSADGSRVVTASDDGTARVWDLTGEHPTAVVLEGHAERVNAASFSPDGRQVVTASSDGTARVWQVYPDIAELSALVVRRLSRCLSIAQRESFGLRTSAGPEDRDVIPAPAADGRCPR